MKKIKYLRSLILVQKATLLLGLTTTPLSVRADLPSSPFPLGRSDLVEIRTVKELRPGLTHVHVERGAWPKEGPPKLSLVSEPRRNKAELAPIRDCLERMGYTVREHQIMIKPSTDPYYVLFAGEFDGYEEGRKALRKIPCDVKLGNESSYLDWDTGPWALDIVIVNPQVYRGKVVSAWSGKALRESPLELARKRNAVVAINGSFFEYSIDEVAGIPTGISIAEGEWHSEPRWHSEPNDSRARDRRGIYLDNKDGEISFSIREENAIPFPEFKWVGKDGTDKSIKLDGLDRMPKDNELVAMKPWVVMSHPLSHFIPPHIKIAQIASDGILENGWYYGNDRPVLLATGSKQTIIEEAIASDKPVELDLRIPGRPGLNAWYAVPALMLDGEALPLYDSLYFTRASRTAIGADAMGDIYLMVIDGPRGGLKEGASMGITLSELQDVMKFLGLVNASNLDGGSNSTSMVIEGKVMGHATHLHMDTPYDDDRLVGDMVMVIDE